MEEQKVEALVDRRRWCNEGRCNNQPDKWHERGVVMRADTAAKTGESLYTPSNYAVDSTAGFLQIHAGFLLGRFQLKERHYFCEGMQKKKRLKILKERAFASFQ
jgi:hypothetical protein